MGVLYEIVRGTGTYQCEVHTVEVDKETTDYNGLIDICIDKLESEGRTDCFLDESETIEKGGNYYEDEYTIGGNHGLLLYHGGNLDIRMVDDEILQWVKDYTDYNEADRYLSSIERELSIKNIYDNIKAKDSFCEELKKYLTDNEEGRELLKRLETLLAD